VRPISAGEGAGEVEGGTAGSGRGRGGSLEGEGTSGERDSKTMAWFGRILDRGWSARELCPRRKRRASTNEDEGGRWRAREESVDDLATSLAGKTGKPPRRTARRWRSFGRRRPSILSPVEHRERYGRDRVRMTIGAHM